MKVNMLCDHAKIQYYKDKISNNAKDQKALFGIANELLHKSKDQSLPSAESPQLLANNFACYFVDKIEKINRTFPDSDSDNQPPDSTSMSHAAVPALDSLKEISADDLKKLILKGNSKHCILDPIPTSLLKDTIDCLIPFITQTVNSFNDKQFPSKS